MLKRLREKVQTLGWVDTLVFITALLVRQLSFGSARLVKYYFVAQPVPAIPRSAPNTSGSVRLYVTAAEDALIAQAPRPGEVISSRFAQRARCVVAARNDELAGFIWLCPQRYVEDGVRCVYRWSPASAAEWDFDVYIAPPMRMGRLFLRLWECAHALLREEGVAWTLSRVDAFNAGSLAAHRKLGAQTLAHAWFLVAGRWQMTLVSVAPYWHVSARTETAVELRFDLRSLALQPTAASSATPG